ncbi:MAG: redoxin domain-containing protein, partial [Williamsia sp.]|nr:redoxin domain-containing protein [Williamsia sp.]
MLLKVTTGFFLILLLLSPVSVRSQSVPVIKFDQLEQLVSRSTDTLYVVNFWATWCAPCVKELPQFEALNRARADRKIKVMLVSMDARKTLATKAIPFIRTRKVKSQVVLLDETDLNTW